MTLFTNNQSILNEAINPRRNFAANAVQGSCGRRAKYCNYYNTSGCRHGKECWFIHQSNPNSVNQLLLNQINVMNKSILQSNMLIKQLNDNQIINTQQLNQKIDNILLQINKMNNNQMENNIKINKEINNTIKNTMTVGEEYIIKNILEQFKTHTVSQMNNLKMDFSLIHNQLMDSIENVLQMSHYSDEINLQCEFKTTTSNIQSKTELKLNEEIIDVKKLDVQFDINTASVISQSNLNTTSIHPQSTDEKSIQNNHSKNELQLDVQHNINTKTHLGKWHKLFGIYMKFHNHVATQTIDIKELSVTKDYAHELPLGNIVHNSDLLKHKVPIIKNKTTKSNTNLSKAPTFLNADQLDEKQSKDKQLIIESQNLCDWYPDCYNGDKCNWYHPKSKKEYKLIIKDELCWKYPNCPYGDDCRFLHVSSDEESIEESVT